MKTSFLICSLLIVAAISLSARTQSETLTNASIIEMTKAGLPAEIILRKIRTSNTQFEVWVNALVELKNAKVADEVITEMIDRQDLKPPNGLPDNAPAWSESGLTPNASGSAPEIPKTKKAALASARTIAFGKSSIHPSRQALEKELMKRPDFQRLNLTIQRYKETADLYAEIGYVPLSWITHRYVYRIYDRRSGAVLAAGETTSWGSLAENLAEHIAKSLNYINAGTAI